MLTVTIPWPTSAAGHGPNARHGHWSGRHKAAKASSRLGWALALEAGARKLAMPPEGPILVHLAFHPPHGKRPDVDNAISRCKGHLDGIALALGLDDARFEISYVFNSSQRPGKIEITVRAP